MTPTPWKTPLYMRGASFFACNSPCNCNLRTCQHIVLPIRRAGCAPNLDCLEPVGNRHRTASCYSAGYEGSMKRVSEMAARKLRNKCTLLLSTWRRCLRRDITARVKLRDSYGTSELFRGSSKPLLPPCAERKLMSQRYQSLNVDWLVAGRRVCSKTGQMDL